MLIPSIKNRYTERILYSYCLIFYFIGFMANVYANDSKESTPQLNFQHCKVEIMNELKTIYHRLPKALHLTDHKLTIRCINRVLKFGFKFSQKANHSTLFLGHLHAIKQRRVLYRLEHLSQDEREQLWHARGVVHALLMITTKSKQWYLDQRFRMANGWNEDGDQAKNTDIWGYSRPLGQTSARMDFVTFGEEWFIRPPRRVQTPDNRIECQSFSHSRFFNQQFRPQEKDRPPATCKQFWTWSKQYSAIELIFTSPAKSLVSSFGHLSVLLRANNDTDPDDLDPVYQYVGLVSNSTHSSKNWEFIFSNIPLVLQPESYANFARQNRLYENRRVYRFKMKLTLSQQTWIKARLWEQVRRFNTTYQFLTENCAEQVLRLFDMIHLHKPLKQPGITVSPMGVISLLSQAGMLIKEPIYRVGIDEELQSIRKDLVKQKAMLHSNKMIPPLNDHLTTDLLQKWHLFVESINTYNDQLFEYLHKIQDYYDLLAWRTPPTQSNIVPTEGIEFLGLKNTIFHEEKMAHEVIDLLSEWYKTKENKDATKSKEHALADALIALIGDKNLQLGLGHEASILPVQKTQHLNSTKSNSIWGSDGSFTIGNEYHLHAKELNFQLYTSLYDELQGQQRSVLHPPVRDLKIIKLNFESNFDDLYQFEIEPFSIYQRSNFMDVSWLGIRFESLLKYSHFAYGMKINLGPSIQVLQWQLGQGDLSVGIVGRSSFLSTNALDLQWPVFSSIGIPLGQSFFVRSYIETNLFPLTTTSINYLINVQIETLLSLNNHQRMSILPKLEYLSDPTEQHLIIGLHLRVQ